MESAVVVWPLLPSKEKVARWRTMLHGLPALGLSLVCSAAAANPMDVGNATRGEIARLPEYCNHVWGYSRDPQERAAWFARMGPVFEHMHHYCWAMVKANRAATPGIEPQVRRSLYASAVSECQYVLRNYPDPAFVLRPEILYRMGRFEEANGEWVRAIEYYEQSIGAKADYWPPYMAIADIHVRLGRRDRAAAVLEAGRGVMPDEPRIREAIDKLNSRPELPARASPRRGAP